MNRCGSILTIAAIVFSFIPAQFINAAGFGLTPSSINLGLIERNQVRSGTFTVRRNTTLQSDLKLKVSSSDKSGEDFFEGEEFITFPAGSTSIPYTFNIKPDFRFRCDHSMRIFFVTADGFQSASSAIQVAIVGNVYFSSEGDSDCPSVTPPSSTPPSSTSTSTPQGTEPVKEPPVLPEIISEKTPVENVVVPDAKPEIPKEVVKKLLESKIETTVIVPETKYVSGEELKTVKEIQRISEEITRHKTMKVEKRIELKQDHLTVVTISWPDISNEKEDGSIHVQYRYVLNNDKTVLPDELLQSDSVPYKQFSLPDGVYYFHVAKEVSGQLGRIQTEKFVIDHTPPMIVQAEPQRYKRYWFEDSTYRLVFDAVDHTSGIDYYVVRYEEGEKIVRGNQLKLQRLNLGDHLIQVTAVDKVGNAETESLIVNIDKTYKASEQISSFLTSKVNQLLQWINVI